MDPAVADSIQVAQDTVYVLQSTSPPWHQRPSFWVSLAIAVFTGIYMIFTMRIFWKTEKQAEAAQKSADASQEAAEASQASLKEQQRANRQRTIERVHPLLWLDVKSRYTNGVKNVDVMVRNGSSNPSLDVYLLYFFRFNTNSASWHRKESYFDEVLYETARTLKINGKFGYHFSSELEALEGKEDAKSEFQLPVLPGKIYCLLQYRDIHGNNFARFFYHLYRPSRQEDEVGKYLVGSVSPYGTSVTDRFAWFRNSRDSSVPGSILRENEGFNRDPEKEVPEYSHEEKSIGSKIDKLNHFLKSSARIDKTEFVTMTPISGRPANHWAVGPYDSA